MIFLYPPKLKTGLLIFLMGAFFFCCKPFEIKKEAPAINRVAKNTSFMINLPEDHRLGSTWQLRGDYNPTVVQYVNEVWHGNEKGIYFNLRALAVGQTTLVFVKRKYADTTDTKAFIINIGAP